MSGHSKWSKVKHQKAVTDVAKSAAFTKASRGITIAVKEGGGVTDPNQNFHLRLAIEKARGVNMPKENIARAIAHGTGGGASLEHISYEGYGPGGVALVIEATTDNRQRTVSQIKNILERTGGTLAAPGAVDYLFKRRGVLTVPKSAMTIDALLEAAIDAGADDVVEATDLFEVYTLPSAFVAVRLALEEKQVVIDNAVLIMHPETIVQTDDSARARIDTLIEELEALDDVQSVYTNMT